MPPTKRNDQIYSKRTAPKTSVKERVERRTRYSSRIIMYLRFVLDIGIKKKKKKNPLVPFILYNYIIYYNGTPMKNNKSVRGWYTIFMYILIVQYITLEYNIIYIIFKYVFSLPFQPLLPTTSHIIIYTHMGSATVNIIWYTLLYIILY